MKLFHATYGERYPIRLFYNPKEFIDANGDGRSYTAVARTHVALEPVIAGNAPYPETGGHYGSVASDLDTPIYSSIGFLFSHKARTSPADCFSFANNSERSAFDEYKVRVVHL